MFKKNKPTIRETQNSELLNNLSAELNPKKDILELVFDLLKTGLVVFILAFLLRYFVIQPFLVDGQSMMPNYFNHDYLLIEKLSYLMNDPKRGDVVVFRYPKNTELSYIKRIIALPNETIKIANNQITIINSQYPKGSVLKEHYIPSGSETLAFSELNNDGVYERTLKDNEYFVCGDNREHSSDSREWGPVPKANITGRAWLTLLPVDRIEFHKRIAYSTGSVLNLARNIELALSSKTN